MRVCVYEHNKCARVSCVLVPLKPCSLVRPLFRLLFCFLWGPSLPHLPFSLPTLHPSFFKRTKDHLHLKLVLRHRNVRQEGRTPNAGVSCRSGPRHRAEAQRKLLHKLMRKLARRRRTPTMSSTPRTSRARNSSRKTRSTPAWRWCIRRRSLQSREPSLQPSTASR